MTYLEQVRQGFGGLGVSREFMIYVILVLALAGAIFIIGHGFNALRKRLSLKLLPSNWIVNQLRIASILNQAVEQRAVVELQFLPADEERQSITCIPVEAKNGSLALDINHAIKANSTWMQRPVQGTFRVADKRGLMSFYLFTSIIQGVSVKSKDLVRLDLDSPSKLELHQKRAFLRLEPPEEYILGVAIWPEDRLPTGADSRKLKKWGKPPLSYSPEHSLNSLRLKNISAGGVRFMVSREAVKATGVDLAIGARIALLLDVYDPAARKRRRFLLLCRVRNHFEDFSQKCIDIGAQFRHWGRLDGDTSGLRWEALTDEGLDPLSSWIMQRHLEQVRMLDEEEDEWG